MDTKDSKHPRARALARSKQRAGGKAKAVVRRTPASAQRAEPSRTTGRSRTVAPGIREKPPGRPEQTPAFFADARHATDPFAEELGESVVLSATSGEDSEEHYERELPEEEGGPFLETSARTEFAYDVDESNPEDAEPAPWPAVSPGQPPPHRPGGPR